jgi:hypothetical protein
MPLDMRLAPLWRQWAAPLINLIIGVVVGLAGVAAGFGGEKVYRRMRGDHEPAEPEPDRTLRHFEMSPAQHVGIWGLSAGLGVLGRNQRGPSFRLLRLRRVDVRTGGRVSARSALVGEVFDLALRILTSRLVRSRSRQAQERLAELTPEIKEIKRKHANDPNVRQRALIRFYESNHVKPFASCGLNLASVMLSTLLTAVWSPGGRSVRDRVAGTVVVLDP